MNKCCTIPGWNQRSRHLPLHPNRFLLLLISAAVAGWLLAIAWQSLWPDSMWMHQLTALLQTAFLSALKMLIAPLIFFSLLSGVLQLRNATGSLGRLGGYTISYYLLTSGIAIAIGLAVVFFVHPWTNHPPLSADQIPPPPSGLLSQTDGSLITLLQGVIKQLLSNPFNALAELNILGILFSAILLGLALAVTLPTTSTLPARIEEITQAVYKIAAWVLKLLPLGLFAIAFQLSDRIEATTLVSLSQFAAVVFGATALHGLLVLPALAWLFTGVPPWRLLPAVSQPMLTALVTSSSAATLPLSLTTAQEKLGVERARAASGHSAIG